MGKQFRIISAVETRGSVNSISLTFIPDVIIVVQTGGNVLLAKINGDRAHDSQQKQGGGMPQEPLVKLYETRISEANISKVVRTTRDDFAFATSKGVLFFRLNKDMTLEPSCQVTCIPGCDITELSEYAIDQYVVASWQSNDYLTFDRKNPSAKPLLLKEPLWCNNLCTDLVPMPDYHPIFYPFYISKSLRSVKLINFKNRKIYTLVETQDMPPDCYGYKKLSLAKTQDGRLKIVFVSSEGENTIVQEV